MQYLLSDSTGLMDPSVCISTDLNLKLTPGCVIYLLQSNGHPDFSAIFGRQILNVKFLIKFKEVVLYIN